MTTAVLVKWENQDKLSGGRSSGKMRKLSKEQGDGWSEKESGVAEITREPRMRCCVFSI